MANCCIHRLDKLGIMVKRCVAGGCSSTHRDGLHLYKFPNDPELKKKWAYQVKRTRDKWEPTPYSYLCSKHFEENCFQPYCQLAESMGVGKVRKLLKADAVPSIFDKPSKIKRTISTSALVEPTAKKRRTAVEKRERSRVLILHYSLYLICFLYRSFKNYAKKLKKVH